MKEQEVIYIKAEYSQPGGEEKKLTTVIDTITSLCNIAARATGSLFLPSGIKRVTF